MILGESHYCDGCDDIKECGDPSRHPGCTDMTSRTIESYLSGEPEKRWHSTFSKFEQTLVDETIDSKKRRDIWESVIFYNFLQVAVGGPRQGGEWDEYRKSDDAFFEVLERYCPDLIIAWGVSRLYACMPGGERWKQGEERVVDGYRVLNGYYLLKDGTKIRTIWIYHPSGGFTPGWWRKVVLPEIKEEVAGNLPTDSAENV